MKKSSLHLPLAPSAAAGHSHLATLLPPARGSGQRQALASLLRAASALLAALAQRLAAAEARAAEREALVLRDSVEALLEFHAEAGAPEGALYVDGQLVGLLPGVSRL